MPILYNKRYHTNFNDMYDGLMRLAGMVMFATSIIIITFSLYCWGN